MPDFMDHVQQREQVDRDIAVAAATQRREGVPDCDTCGAAISSLRQSLGARLCLRHQEELEQAQRRRR
jgi:hypothetical protein